MNKNTEFRGKFNTSVIEQLSLIFAHQKNISVFSLCYKNKKNT